MPKNLLRYQNRSKLSQVVRIAWDVESDLSAHKAGVSCWFDYFQGEGDAQETASSVLGCALRTVCVPGIDPSALGQQVFGSIYGTVTDQTGAGVPNAKVTITDQEKGTKYEVTTNEVGNYTKDRLIPGDVHG